MVGPEEMEQVARARIRFRGAKTDGRRMQDRAQWPIIPATLPGGLNELIKKKLITAGVVVTEDDSAQVADVKQVRRHVFAGQWPVPPAGYLAGELNGFWRRSAAEQDKRGLTPKEGDRWRHRPLPQTKVKGRVADFIS